MVEDWIQRWQTTKDEAAAEALYDYFYLRLFRLAFGLLGDAHEAEDVMQETMKYALENIGRYDANRAQFSTWLHTIAVSRVRDKQRRNMVASKFLARLFLQGKQTTNLSAENIAVQRQRSDSVRTAVQQLSLEQREVVVLRYWGNHTFAEISQIVGKSEGTIKSRLRLAHQQLQRLMDWSEQMEFLDE